MVRRKKAVIVVEELPEKKPVAVEDTPVIAKPIRKQTVKRTQYFVANNHTGDIVFPRSGRGILKTVPLTLPAGRSVIVDADEWNQLKKNKSVVNYIDAGLISEVMKEGEVAVMSNTTAELPIPEHLQREEETGKTHQEVKATRRRQTVSRITV